MSHDRWEGLKIVATLDRLDLGIRAHGPATQVKRGDQKGFADNLGAGLSKLRAQDWAEGTWAFFVK